MILEVDYIDRRRIRAVVPVNISYLQFLKSFVVAGQGRMPTVTTWKEMFGNNFSYGRFFRTRFFRHFAFRAPAGDRYDPTAQGDFSTLVGKAFADILAKRLSGATLTFGYEAALKEAGHSLAGQRPDMFCVSPASTFAIEAKGFNDASVSDNAMRAHKVQASSGQLHADFHVACVSYNLYDQPKCKYHDPEGTGEESSRGFLHNLVQSYYEGWNTFLKMSMIQKDEVLFGGRRYHLISMILTVAGDYVEPHHLLLDCLAMQSGLRGEVPPTGLTRNSANVFVDADGVGLCSDRGAELLVNKRPIKLLSL